MSIIDITYTDYAPPESEGGYAPPKRYAYGEETLTFQDVIDTYIRAYQMLYGKKPNCTHLEGLWYLVDDTMRDRRWVLLEIERLRQEALVAAVDEGRSNPKSSVMRLIRRLASL